MLDKLSDEERDLVLDDAENYDTKYGHDTRVMDIIHGDNPDYWKDKKAGLV
jgi:hypothetical protein